MKDAIKVLVVDDNVSSVSAISKYFSSHAVIKVVDSANDGEEALKKLRSKEYDVILLDLIIPKIDGLEVLDIMSKEHIKGKVIILTSYSKEETIRRVSDYGVNYYMLKPFDLKLLEKRITEVVSEPDVVHKKVSNKLDLKVSKMLHNLGVPSHIKGYQYIRDSIIMMYENPKYLGGITKELYPDIAMKYETTPSRVERAIRHAIEVSWNRGDYELMEEIFGNSVDYDRAKPTNSEFIATVTDKIRMDGVVELQMV